MKKTFNLITGALLLAVVFSGCQTNPEKGVDLDFLTSGSTSQQIAFELATKVAVSEAINGDKDIAQVVFNFSDLLIKSLGSGEVAIPEMVDDIVMEWIAATDLEPGTKQLLAFVVASIKSEYLAQVESGVLDPATTAPLLEIATWVNESAKLALIYSE